MYSKSCGSSRVDEARHHLFSNGTKSLENLPPTQAALIQHIKRALLQASFYWNQATAVQQDIPEFNAWGWFRDSTSKTWEPYWTNLRDASKACTILLHCGCKTACRWHSEKHIKFVFVTHVVQKLKPGPFSGGGHIGFGRHLGPEGRWLRRPS
ncbi:hypothetical protein PO909_012952 [Leuciscus waleckii]